MKLLLRCAVLLVVCLAPFFSFGQNARDDAWSTLDMGLKSSNIEKRIKAVGELGLLPDNKLALDAAVSALADNKSEVRAAAAQALGEMGATGAKPRLVDALQDSDVAVVLSAAHALVILGDDTGYEVFYAVLTGEQKGGSSLLEQQKKMLDDPKKLAGLGFQTGLGFVPFGGLGYSAFKLITRDDSSPVVAAAAITLAKDPDPRSGKALADAALDQKKSGSSGLLPSTPLPSVATSV